MPPLPRILPNPCPKVVLGAASFFRRHVRHDGPAQFGASCRLLAQVLLWGLVVLLIGLRPVQAAAPPVDDLDRQSLVRALARSLSYLESRPSKTRYHLGPNVMPVSRLLDTVRHLHYLAASRLDPDAFQQRISEDFDRISLLTPERRLLLTGYYQPVFHGSTHQGAPFLYPLYRLPQDMVVKPQPGKKPIIGRLHEGRLHPYWSRQEIEQRALLQGEELVWLRDPFDAFTLHVQGSGILRLTDGSLRGVHYAQSNGRTYTSVGKFLVATGRMQLAEVTMDSIRRYLEQHPHELALILHQNDSFIFFDWCPPGAAVGSLQQPLTPGRSVAADQRIYPPGSILWVKSRRPTVAQGEVAAWTPMQRLLTVQDTGSAIQGPGRLDIFWGTGEQAGLEAGQMKEAGEVVLLLLKESVAPCSARR
ncbi:MAG: MltA domain-containing protein [Desulfobulbus sp.]|nr:MltA domain-containing protein [Desulfobulbus sp.]